jgi:hypothetical protein
MTRSEAMLRNREDSIGLSKRMRLRWTDPEERNRLQILLRRSTCRQCHPFTADVHFEGGRRTCGICARERKRRYAALPEARKRKALADKCRWLRSLEANRQRARLTARARKRELLRTIFGGVSR